jgi:hypothetical protein
MCEEIHAIFSLRKEGKNYLWRHGNEERWK